MDIKAYLFGDKVRPTQTATFWAPTGPSGHINGADTTFATSNAPWNADLWRAIAPGCRSLSVGDLVVVAIDGIAKGFVCKGCGWGEVASENLSLAIAKLEYAGGFSERGILAEEFSEMAPKLGTVLPVTIPMPFAE